MTEVSVATAETETRQSMIRVWMAISAVWVSFWLLIIGLFMLTLDLQYPFDQQLSLFALIILSPPLVLLAIGATARWSFEKFSLRRK